MIEFAVLATGPSMSEELAQSVGRCIAVNDAYQLRPDAEALTANDRAWWMAHVDALKFKGRKFSTNPPPKSAVEQVKQTEMIRSATNSALLGLHVAITLFGATRILLYGVDMTAARGAHYFGTHATGLQNTRPDRFEVFKRQFADYARQLPKGVAVYNATPQSALRCFPFLN